MTKCEGEHHKGEEFSVKSKIFRISDLTVTDDGNIFRETVIRTGFASRDPMPEHTQDSKAKCFIEQEMEEYIGEYECAVGRSFGPASGACSKCGKSVWVLFKRIS